MSRGPGSFQKDILDRIQRNRGQMISWDELKESFPLRVGNRSLHRAVRSLKRMGYLREDHLNGRRWFAYCSPRGMRKADREWLESCNEAAWYLRMAAKARGIAVPVEAAELDAAVDAYHRQTLWRE
jgi:hypothetical protein